MGCAHRQIAGKAIIQRYFEEWANRGNAAVADELIATNLVLRNPPAVIRSLEDYKTGMARFHAAFPDAHYTVADPISNKPAAFGKSQNANSQAVQLCGETKTLIAQAFRYWRKPVA